jgi:hypothetical protein
MPWRCYSLLLGVWDRQTPSNQSISPTLLSPTPKTTANHPSPLAFSFTVWQTPSNGKPLSPIPKTNDNGCRSTVTIGKLLPTTPPPPDYFPSPSFQATIDGLQLSFDSFLPTQQYPPHPNTPKTIILSIFWKTPPKESPWPNESSSACGRQPPNFRGCLPPRKVTVRHSPHPLSVVEDNAEGRV